MYTIQQLYTLIVPLIRLPKLPAKLKGKSADLIMEWAKTAKLRVKKTDPLHVINDPILYSENYTLSNKVTQVSGYEKIGSYKVRIHRKRNNLNVPTWSNVLLACDPKYLKEGIGLLLLERSAQPADPEKLFEGKNTEFDVEVYQKPPLFSKKGMRKLSNVQVREMFTKGPTYWNKEEYRRNAWLFIDREFWRRFDRYSPHYQKYLDIITVKANMHKIEDGTYTVPNKEKCVTDLKALLKRMEDYPLYWKYHYLDTQIPQ